MEHKTARKKIEVRQLRQYKMSCRDRIVKKAEYSSWDQKNPKKKKSKRKSIKKSRMDHQGVGLRELYKSSPSSKKELPSPKVHTRIKTL